MRTFQSLRIRVVLLVLLAVLPAAIVIYYSAADRRSDNAHRVQVQNLQLATASANAVSGQISATREFLLPLAQLLALFPTLSALNEAACAPTFGALTDLDPHLLSLSTALPDGTLVCGNQPGTAAPGSVADEAFFKEAVASRSFAVSPISVDRVTGKSTLQAAYPVIGADDDVLRGVVFASIDLTQLSDRLGGSSLPAGSFITLVGASGTILGRYPDAERWVGQPVSAPPADPGAGGRTDEGESLDGTPVLYASVRVPAIESGDTNPSSDLNGAVLSVGIPKDVAFAGLDARLRNDLLLLLAVAIVASAAAWVGGGLIVGKVHAYVATTQRFAGGDLSARTGPPYPSSELGTLGRAFDDMATTIGAREQEISDLNDGLERRVAIRTRELEQANAELESFSYSVSHDLRAPLRSIDGFSRIIVEDHGDELSEETNRLFARVRASAKQMGQLVDDLLTFSRLGRRAITRATVDVRQLALDTYAERANELGDRTVEFSVGALPPCEADASLLRQVFVNLLENAIKFTRSRPDARIEVSAETVDGETVYCVKDNGAGFDMKYADKLFGVFQRLHRADEYEGTGVGLAIVQRVIHRHGGRVWADAAPGNGAAFYFTIPGGEPE